MASSRRRALHFTLHKVMEELGYRVSGIDPCPFARSDSPELIIVIINVDDGVFTGLKSLMMAALTEICNKLDIKQLGEAHVFLARCGDRMWVGQEKYIAGMLERLNMKDCKPVKTPIAVGKIPSKEGEALEVDT
jgi:hypothetical protein